MEPGELLQVYNEMDTQGWELLAIYHSHPHTQAYPSITDVSRAHWPGTVYLIVSLEDKANPVTRAFRIEDGNITEEELQVV